MSGDKQKMTCVFDKEFLNEVKRHVVWAQLHGDDVSLTKACAVGLEHWCKGMKDKHGEPEGHLKLSRGGPLKI
jgi:hypothetical protein